MKKIRFTKAILLLAFSWVLIFPSCKEKNTEFPPRTWDTFFYETTEIAPRTVSSIFYENDHSIWLGAAGTEGLLLQDGYKWNEYNKDNTGISFDSVASFARDGNNRLWVGWKTGLATFEGSNWQKSGLFDGLNITSVVVEGIENIKVGIKGKSGGMASMNQNHWTFYTLLNSDIPSENINAMVSDHEQALWMATADKGIVRFKNEKWEVVSTDISLVSQEFTCLTLSPDGSIWAGSAASQLIHFYDGTFVVYNTGTSKPITSVVVSDDGNLWCSTLGAGLVKFDGSSWSSYTMENAYLPSNDILCLSKGYPGNLFFSIPGGKVLMINQ